jgi:hypothetical protein
MKKWMIGAVGAIAALALFGVALADFENGSFETGDGEGWGGNAGSAGTITVVTTCSNVDFCTTVNPFAPYLPVDGTYFAILVGGSQDEFTTISQEIEVDEGDDIEGYVFFHDQESFGQTVFCDTGEVRILDGTDVIATLFSENACGADIEDSTDWTLFSYEATESGTLTLEARVANLGDSLVPPVLGLDAVDADGQPVVFMPTPRPRTNVAGGIAGIFTPSQAITPAGSVPGRAPATDAPISPPSTGAGVTIVPPSTGDAGLAGRDGAPVVGVIAAVAAAVTVAGLKVRAYRA